MRLQERERLQEMERLQERERFRNPLDARLALKLASRFSFQKKS